MTRQKGSGRPSTFLLATRNAKKARELRRLLRGAGLRVITLEQFPTIPPVREDRPTLRANAVKKAVETSRRTDLPVLADDSGLEVRALGGGPGVRSARLAGPAPRPALSRAEGRGSGQTQDDRANIAKLLRLLRRVPASRRRARFVCVLALARRGRLLRTFEGVCSGVVAREPAGRTGFGYDPIFIPRGHRRTLAQLGPAVKDRLSHRTRAVQAFARWLGERARRPRR